MVVGITGLVYFEILRCSLFPYCIFPFYDVGAETKWSMLC